MREISNIIFDLLVKWLIDLSHFLGITYKEINIIIFCILEPIVYLIMLIIIYKQWKLIKSLKQIK